MNYWPFSSSRNQYQSRLELEFELAVFDQNRKEFWESIPDWLGEVGFELPKKGDHLMIEDKYFTVKNRIYKGSEYENGQPLLVFIVEEYTGEYTSEMKSP